MTALGVLFVVTGVGYAVASGLYLTRLARGTQGAVRFAAQALVAAVGLHLIYLVADYVSPTAPMRGVHQTLTVISLGVVVTFLVASKRKPALEILGAFLSPVTLLFFLGSGLGRSVAEVPQTVRSALLPIHVGVCILGIVAFALAFAAAIAYVLQERLLRRKQLGGLFQRLPPLDVLDALGFRSVTVGFPLLTLGIVTGAFWTLRLNPDSPPLTATHAFALVAWVIFAGVLTLRIAAGWRGRRAAVGTILGFLSASAVLVGYVVRGAGGAL